MQTQHLVLSDPTQLPSAQRRLHYTSYGEAGQSPILCVHGLTRNGRDFDALAQSLEPTHRVLCPDMAGRGQSEWLVQTSNYHYGTYLTDISQFLASQSLAQVGWIGTSMGGILGMMAAAANPSLIKWLVLNDVGAMIPAASLVRIVNYASRPPHFDLREEAEAALRKNGVTFGLKTPEEWRQFTEATLEPAPEGGWRFAYDPEIIGPLLQQAQEGGLSDVDLTAVWDAVQCPVLLLRGADSDVLPADVAQKMAQRAGVTLVEFAQVGHAPALLSAEQILTVTGWIKNCESQR